MEWSERLYVGASLKKKAEAVKAALEEGSAPVQVRVITPAANGADLLDIWRGALCPKDSLVLGIAGSKREAFELVRQIAEDCFKETQDADLRSFLM